MHKLLSVFSVIVTIFFCSCSNISIEIGEDKLFYSGGTVSIYVGETSEIEPYKVYINQEDTEVNLHQNMQTRFGIIEGKTNIQIVKGHTTASLDIFVNSENEYFLKIIQNEKGKIELLQVPKSSIPSDVKETMLYVNETTQKAESDAKASAILSNYGDEPVFEMQTKGVDENTKAPKNGDTIFYYELEDGE